MSKVIVIYGATGTGKSSFVQSSSRSKWYAELDPGSLDRAKKYHGGELEYHTYYEPLTALEDMGVLDRSMTGSSGLGAVQVAHRYSGWREKYWEFVSDYLAFLKTGPEYGIIDTSTILWNMAQNALRQRLQEEGGPREVQSDRLKRLEYQEPNDQLMSMIKGAKGAQKDLVLVAHRGEVWFNDKPTGKWKPDGWNKALDNADIGLMFDVRSARPVATITKAGGCPLDLVGWEIESPTLDGVCELVDAARAVTDAEWDLPSEGDYPARIAALLEMAEKVG